MNSFLKKRGLNRMDLCYLAALTCHPACGDYRRLADVLGSVDF